MQGLDYYATLIAVADDCAADTSTVPQPRGGKKTAAVIQYELLVEQPHELTSREIIFRSWLERQDLPDPVPPAHRARLEAEFFAKPQACLRASPLPKSYGWGLLFDDQGRVALLPRESSEYARIAAGSDVKYAVVKAMRSRRT